MKFILVHISWLLGIFFSIHAQESYSKDTVLMGSAFRFTAIHHNYTTAITSVNVAIIEVIRIEKLISSWDAKSETSKINNNAGVAPVKVTYELFSLIERTKKISEISNGYFDISYASLDIVWDFNNSVMPIPTEEELQLSISKIDYHNIILDTKDTSVFLVKKGMKIGFGSIGKGYAANRAKQIMIAAGVQSGVVNAGGDLLAWGSKISGSPWVVGIVDPFNKEDVTLWLDVKDMAVVTSGNYEKSITIGDNTYCHIINPKTGWPVNGLASVTIMCIDAELADALATTVFVLGMEEGLALINHLEGIEGVLISDNGIIQYSDKFTN